MILQDLGKLLNLIEGLHSSLLGLIKTCKPSLRKPTERSFIPAALQMFVLLKVFSVDFCSICWVKNISLNKMSIKLYYGVKIYLLGGVQSFFKGLSAKIEWCLQDI